jgi:rod shape-determining protein MreD
MAINKPPQGSSVIAITVLVAVMLMLVPLPDSVRLFRPEFVVLALIYWTMALPQRVGVGYAWTIGLLMDLIMGGSLGVLAFAYALISYIVSVVHLQLRQYPIWQQAVSVFAMILLMHLLLILITPREAGVTFGLPALVSMILWPAVYALLRSIRLTFHVS